MSGRREMQILVRDLEKAGFHVARTGSGHWRVTSPWNSGFVIMAFSPNHTGFQKTMARLKKIGYVPK